MTESGQPQRYNTFIDIPDSLRLPHFMLAEGPVFEELNGLSTEYKLVLQSVVCHRGDSLQSGHYIAFARVAPKLLTGNRRHNFDPPPDYEEAQWVKFDDLDLKNRVAYVDDIKQALRVEMPYLLFYQIVPMFDMLRISVDETRTEPPSYNESRTSFELGHNDLSSSAHGALGGNHRDELLELRSKPPSIRLSAEMDRSARNSLWTTSHTGSTPMGSRRQSLANTESSPATPGANSPVLSPVDETTTSRLSRAASRFTLGRQSRPPSQSGETRISFSMARLGGLMKSSREPLVAENGASPVPLSVSTGPASDPAAKTPDSPVDVTPQIKEKHKHRGSKVKADKHNKSEQDEPPERECSVM
ncbi:ubiquitin hydrolase family protein [Moelleriella libera RCEF 2490]|uniref:Ubiquitin hydrolase family protein n=1 Tax=Moelleriella libera RCEF 2490 TaxID=1081109 RepID=A0A167W286_9HYPO|nr:ubiquitin hydrolase family protein [Moelleriella libera RCEF 2490]